MAQKKQLKQMIEFQQDIIFGITKQCISSPNGKMQQVLLKAIEANQEVIFLMQCEIDIKRAENITLWLDDVL